MSAERKGQTAIVTGAGRGIGRAIAERLAASGVSVVAVARNAEQLAQTCDAINKAGGRAKAVAADVSNEAQVQRVITEATAAFGPPTILVNNAGVAPVSPIETMSTESFDQLIAVNVRAPFLLCRAVWPIMKKAGGGGIVNISSVAAIDPFPGLSAYGGSKAFVSTFTRALAAEGRPDGIRVFGVAPGAVETTMLRGAFADYPRDQTLDPKAVAELVATLLSPACQYSTGETITIRRT